MTNSRFPNPKAPPDSHSAPLQSWTMVTSPSSKLFLWHFFILLVYCLSLCLFSWYLLNTSYELGTFQVLGTEQWVKQANPCSDSAYLSAILFYFFLCLMLLQPWASPEDVSLLTLPFHICPEVSFLQLLVLMPPIHSEQLKDCPISFELQVQLSNPSWSRSTFKLQQYSKFNI